MHLSRNIPMGRWRLTDLDGVVKTLATRAASAVVNQVRSIHWSPYDSVGVVNADP